MVQLRIILASISKSSVKHVTQHCIRNMWTISRTTVSQSKRIIRTEIFKWLFIWWFILIWAAFNCGGIERKYGPIWRKIDARWTLQLHWPLHAVGYYLNPQLCYEDKFSNMDEVRKRLFECIDRILNYHDHLKVDIQLDVYDHTNG